MNKGWSWRGNEDLFLAVAEAEETRVEGKYGPVFNKRNFVCSSSIYGAGLAQAV
jgi:hypothetical protein